MEQGGRKANLSGQAQEQAIADILENYGDWSGDRLSYNTHQEDPWINTYRNGMGKNSIISKEEMRNYYSSLIH